MSLRLDSRMKLEEDIGLDRGIEIETDDEDNEAETACDQNDDDDTESDVTSPPQHRSNSCTDDPSPRWPQSYRQSLDMFTSVTPPSLSLLRGSSLWNSFGKRQQSSATESSLIRPLISATRLEKEFLTSTLPVKLSITSETRISISELLPSEQCSYSQSLLNAINALCGIGILATPYALKEGGWFSLILLFIFGSITCYTGILLKQCLDSSPHLQTYPDIGEAAFGLGGRICIATILYVELYSSCVEFLIMMSDNLSAFFPNAKLEIVGIHLDSYQICAVTSTLVILPTVWLRNLSLLSYVSVGGVVTLVVVVLCLLWFGISGEVGFHPNGKALNLTSLPVTIGLYSFCYGSHSVFPNIYTSMREPSRFPSVLLISFVIAAFFYTGVGICGFLLFGEATKPQFTLNLPTKSVPTNIAGWSVVAAPLTKFSMTITPVALAVEELLPSTHSRSHGVSILIRTSLVISTLIVALAVPYFGSVTALIGSLLVMLVSLIMPCACYMKIGRDRLTKFQTAACTFIIIFGTICAFIGTYSAVTTKAV